MKRGIIYLLLSSIVLFIVIALSEEGKKFEPIIPTPTSAQMLTEPEYSDSDQRDYKVVVDATGKERRLYLGEVDTKKRYKEFYDSNPTAVYSQVENDHYYFMRSNGKRRYTIFRDKGETVGKFKIKQGYVNGFIKYGSHFYLEWRNRLEEGKRVGRLAEVNLDKGNIEFLADTDLAGKEKYIYGNQLYIREATYLRVYDLEGKCYKENIETTDYFQGLVPLNLVDGKFYYGICEGNKVKLFAFDPKVNRGEEILYFKHKEVQGNGGVYVEMDDKNIYCTGYVIPRKGGKIYKESHSHKKRSGRFYDNNLFYLDDNYKVHRVSKGIGKDRIITKIKAMDVAWTKQNVYIQAYDKEIVDYYNDDGDDDDDYDGEGDDDYEISDYSSIYQSKDDPTSWNLYCMDLDGKNMEKIAD